MTKFLEIQPLFEVSWSLCRWSMRRVKEMVNPIASATQSQATAQATAARPPAPQPKPQPASVPTDTVVISAAAKAMQEMSETPAQTAQEAAAGDN
ncbi:MAG: hypothetical protein WA463_00805, partial [Terriglobales bacterium]